VIAFWFFLDRDIRTMRHLHETADSHSIV